MRFGRTDESAAQCGTSIRRRHGTRFLRLTTVNQRTQGTTAKQRRIQTRHWPRHDSPDPTVPACSAEDPHWNGHVTLQTGGTCTPQSTLSPKAFALPERNASNVLRHWRSTSCTSCEATTKPLPDARPQTVPQPADSVPAWLRHHPATSIHRPGKRSVHAAHIATDRTFAAPASAIREPRESRLTSFTPRLFR